MQKILLTLCLSVIPAMAADVYTFTVPDGVNISSFAGTVTGWGYSIHNESTSLWLVPTGLSTGTFQYATPDLIFDFPDVAPGATAAVPFNPLTPAGLFVITWDPTVPNGFVNSGTFGLSAQWWNGNPLNGGSLVSAAPGETQTYSASLTSIPEPASIELFGCVLLILGVGACFQRKNVIRERAVGSFS